MKIVPSRTIRSAGPTSQTFKECGLIHSDVATVSTADDTETTLYTYTLPGGTLANDGDFLHIECRGVYGGTNESKTNKIYFGATTVDTFATTSNTHKWYQSAHVVRTSATAQKATGFYDRGAQGDGELTTPAETLSGDIIIKATGQGITSEANGVSGYGFKIWYYRVP